MPHPEPRPYRLLITGSRDWADQRAVSLAITRAIGPGQLVPARARPIIVVHGACPTGADHFAAWFVRHNGERLGITEEPMPADWDHCGPDCPPTRHRVTKRPGDIHHPGVLDTYCPYAGPRRNAAMVALGADACIAFPLGTRRRSGTRNAIRLARQAGIPVTVITPTPEQQ